MSCSTLIRLGLRLDLQVLSMMNAFCGCSMISHSQCPAHILAQFKNRDSGSLVNMQSVMSASG